MVTPSFRSLKKFMYSKSMSQIREMWIAERIRSIRVELVRADCRYGGNDSGYDMNNEEKDV